MVYAILPDVRGFGRQWGRAGDPPEAHNPFKLLPKLKLEILVKANDVKQTLEVFATHLRTGKFGDGKIGVLKVAAARRVRTGDKGIWAI